METPSTISTCSNNTTYSRVVQLASTRDASGSFASYAGWQRVGRDNTTYTVCDRQSSHQGPNFNDRERWDVNRVLKNGGPKSGPRMDRHS